MFWVSAQCLSHGSIFFPLSSLEHVLCSHLSKTAARGSSWSSGAELGRGLVPVLVHSLVVGACAQGSGLVVLILQSLSPTVLPPCVTWAMARTGSGAAVDFKLPDLKSRGRALTLLSSSAWLGMQLKGCREAKKDGLLLKEMVIKLYPKICIPQVCFTFSYGDLSSLLPKRKDFSIFFTVLPCQANISTFHTNICESNIRNVLFHYLTAEDYSHTVL